MNLPLVSVLVITYNQEAYIAQCLKSLMSQKTNFDFEIIVYDDVSSDTTYQIAEEMSATTTYLNVFRNEKNLGPAGNFEKALLKCRGRFIAFCEGDDFWCDPLKLQKQVKTLQQDGSASMVYADYGKVDDKGDILQKNTLKKPNQYFTIQDFIDDSGPVLNSMMVRREVFPKKFPNAFFTVQNPDVFIVGWALIKGRATFIPEVLSMYRTHSEGIYSSKKNIEKQLLRYSTRILFFQSLNSSAYKNLTKQAEMGLQSTLISAKRSGEDELFKIYFAKLPILKRIKFKWLQRYYNLRVGGTEKK